MNITTFMRRILESRKIIGGALKTAQLVLNYKIRDVIRSAGQMFVIAGLMSDVARRLSKMYSRAAAISG